MAVLLQRYPAGGGPGIAPRWTRSDKDGVGTAYSALSKVWFTASKGILNEIYYPTIDRPQIRDLQCLISDGDTFFCDERQLDNIHECLAPGALGYRITNVNPQGRYPLRHSCSQQDEPLSPVHGGSATVRLPSGRSPRGMVSGDAG